MSGARHTDRSGQGAHPSRSAGAHPPSPAPAGLPYLLPILTARDFASANRQYRRYLHTYNRHLAHLSERLGLDRRLTSYTPRHTWASLAFAYGVDTNTISQALCHANPHTTRAYIRDLSNTHLDQANQLVLSRLFGDEKQYI